MSLKQDKSNIILSSVDNNFWMVNSDPTSDSGGLASLTLPSTSIQFYDGGWKDDDDTLSLLGFTLVLYKNNQF